MDGHRGDGWEGRQALLRSVLCWVYVVVSFDFFRDTLKLEV